MSAPLKPVELGILNLTPAQLQTLKPVKVLDIFQQSSDNFHTDGLFSVDIFGRIGSDERDNRWSFIDIKVPIFHPLILAELIKLKNLYGDIITGKKRAIFNPKTRDFEATNDMEGDTGYYFFTSHFHELKLARNQSVRRSDKIDFIEKYRDIAFVTKILVLPAGLRDIETDESGRSIEGEVNEFYRRLISVSNAIASNTDYNNSGYDVARNTMQVAFDNIYNYFNTLLEGKNALIMGKWAKRKIYDATRAVLTANTASVKKLGDKKTPGFNGTVVGLYQALNGLRPVAIHAVLEFVRKHIQVDGTNRLTLLNPKTLKSESVEVNNKTMDLWTTSTGIESIIKSLANFSVRGKPITVEGYVFCLLFKDNKKGFKFIFDIDDIPEGFDRSNAKPITYYEFFYLVNYRRWNNYPNLITRYPIEREGSNYPSRTYVKVTVVSEQRYEYDDNWVLDKENPCLEFPIMDNAEYMDSASVNMTRLAGLGGDHDGDTISVNFVMIDESIQEINNYLDKRESYINPYGGFFASLCREPMELIIHNLTGD